MTKHLLTLLLVLGLAGCATRVEQAELEATLDTWADAPPRAALEVGAAAVDPQVVARNGSTLSLVFVTEGEATLPVREAPSIDAEVIDELDRYTLDVPSTGRREQVHGTTWVEVVTDAGAGWIDADHTTEFVPSEDFCEAPEIADYALREIANGIYVDSPRFAALLSYTHGLRVRYRAGAEPTHLTRQWAETEMDDAQPLEWGVDASGETIRGTFAEIVGDELAHVIANGAVTCNGLTTGTAPNPADIPDSEVNLNFVSVHLPATDERGTNWVTWTIGFAFEDGRPAIATFNRYAGEG